MPNRSIKHYLPLALGLVASGFILGLSVLIVFWSRAIQLENSERRVSEIARLLAEQTARSFAAVNTALLSTTEDMRLAAVGERLQVNRALHDHIRISLANNPQLRALIASDANGDTVLHTQSYPPMQINYADRAYFRAHRDNAHSTIYIGEPIKGRIHGEWAIPVSARISHLQGGFLGVVNASVNPDYFTSFYKSLDFGNESAILLLRNDGVVLMTFPERASWYGRKLTIPDSVSKPDEGTPTLITHESILENDSPHVVFWQPLADQPLTIAISSPKDYLLGDWFKQSLQFIGIVILAIIALLLTLVFLHRKMLQGEALRKDLESSTELWRSAIEAAGHGVWLFDLRSGKIERSNSYHQLLGYQPGTLSDSKDDWTMILHPESISTAQQALEKAQRKPQSGFSAQLTMLHKDGSWRWVYSRGVVLLDQHGKPSSILGTVTDITSLRQVQLSLQESEARLNAIINSAMDAIITVDSEQNIVLFNHAAEHIFAYQATAVYGQPLDILLPERFRSAHRQHVDRFGKTGLSSRKMGEDRVLIARRANGEEFPIETSISQVEINGHKLYTAILRDISARIKAHHDLDHAREELRQLSAVSQSAREEEKSRIARELHDELGQALTALKMDLAYCAERISTDRLDLIERTRAMRTVLDSTVAATRRIAADLRPLVLDDLGLGAAAEWLVQDFSKHSGIVYDLAIDPTCATLADPYSTAFFRILQEALTNTARHSGATRAAIKLWQEKTEVILTIHDNGKGMPDKDQQNVMTYGLTGMKERVYLLNGKIIIDSASDRGTTIEVHIPIPESK